MQTFLLPDPGEGLVEAEIVEWHVAEGDEVSVNQIVVDVETSKSIVELPIPWSGTVATILVPVGETVEVGTPIITIDDGSGETTDADDDSAGEASAERVPVLVGYGAKESSTKRRARRGQASEAERASRDAVAKVFDMPTSRRSDEKAPLAGMEHPAPGQPLPGTGEPPAEPHGALGPVLAKPPVRKLAKDLGVDLRQVAGSGDGGLISREDVLRAANTEATPAEPVAVPRPASTLEDRREPIKGVRKATAAAMVSSAFTAPHVTEWVEVDVTASMELLDRLAARRDFRDVKLSPMALVARAACITLERYPEVNSSWDAEAAEIVYHGEVHLGIAAATPRGLLVPKVRGAQALSLRELVEAISDVVAVARSGKAQPAQLSNGTFTITNVGVFGVDAGTPIITPGEAAILCMGQVSRKPWVVGTGDSERIEPRWVTTLALSFDHRLIDGEQGSKFLAEIAEILSDPAMVLTR